jgi:hypothetical protein
LSNSSVDQAEATSFYTTNGTSMKTSELCVKMPAQDGACMQERTVTSIPPWTTDCD